MRSEGRWLKPYYHQVVTVGPPSKAVVVRLLKVRGAGWSQEHVKGDNNSPLLTPCLWGVVGRGGEGGRTFFFFTGALTIHPSYRHSQLIITVSYYICKSIRIKASAKCCYKYFKIRTF